MQSVDKIENIIERAINIFQLCFYWKSKWNLARFRAIFYLILFMDSSSYKSLVLSGKLVNLFREQNSTKEFILLAKIDRNPRFIRQSNSINTLNLSMYCLEFCRQVLTDTDTPCEIRKLFVFSKSQVFCNQCNNGVAIHEMHYIYNISHFIFWLIQQQ